MSPTPPARGRRLRAASVAAFLFAATAAAAMDFDAWVADLRREALGLGLSPVTIDRALGGIRVLDRVLELQRKQPETTQSWAEYARRVVPRSRIAVGKRRLAAHRALLDSVSARYRVQPRFIVALWGIESDFGRHMGSTPAVSALATLAWGGRRRDYFRQELLELLGSPEVASGGVGLTSSWAGALGQCQFMPSTFRRYAVDWDGDGRRDIWGTKADVFASTARFLNHLGWKDGETWGRPVALPGATARRHDKARLQLSRWDELGVRCLDGGALPDRDLAATLVLPDGADGAAFLVYDDFHALMRWNRSTYFALAVGVLSDALQ